MAPEYITTAEAARRLGVKPATLYAYVSRGLITSHRQPGQQQSLYARSEIDSLASMPSSPRRESGALLRFRSVVSAVSTQDVDSLAYRGTPISLLCKSSSFSDVARLVLDDALTSPFAFDLRPVLKPVHSAPLERRIPIAVALLAACDPMRADVAPQALVARELGFLDCVGDLVGPEIDLSHPHVQALLIALIDNGLAASATAARVAASARAGWYDVQAAGLAAMAGRLHGRAATDVRRCLDAVLAGTSPADVIAQSLETAGHVPGLGHVVYQGDPRVAAVRQAMGRRLEPAAREAWAAANALAKACRAPLNIDAMSAVICASLELPTRAGEVIFQLARTVGITAHAIEEYAEAPLRWRARGDASAPPSDDLRGR